MHIRTAEMETESGRKALSACSKIPLAAYSIKTFTISHEQPGGEWFLV